MRANSSTDVVFGDAQGFLKSAVLACSVRIGVFDFLDSGCATVAELAGVTGLSGTAVRALLDALVAMGYAVRSGAHYSLSPVSKDCLVRGEREYMGDAVDIVAHPAIWSAMGRLAEVARLGGAAIQNTRGPSIVDATDYWIDFAERSDWLTRPVAEAIAVALRADDLTNETWVLDVGCGSGLCGLTLAAANPLVNAILVDRREVLGISGEHAKRLGVADRVTMLPGDALEVLPTRKVDIVIVSLLLHHFDLDTCTRLLRRLGGCMKRRGSIVIHDYLRTETSSGETSIALLAAMLTACTAGDIYTLGDYRRVLKECGFRGCKTFEALPNGESWLIVARKR